MTWKHSRRKGGVRGRAEPCDPESLLFSSSTLETCVYLILRWITKEGLNSPLKTNSADSLLTSMFFLLFSSFHSV